jgi:septum site-determining protein MinC
MAAEAEGVEALFATETMAELCARQGRLAEAMAIYDRLLTKDPSAVAATRWAERLATLKANAIGAESRPEARARVAPEARAPVPASPSPLAQPSVRRMPLVIHETVRSGQLVYAQGTDLIVLASVNPGAQLMADDNIHVYAALRGRAVAGARGEKAARIYCQRLEAELVGIDAAYLTAEDLPRAYLGKSAQVRLESERCAVTAL